MQHAAQNAANFNRSLWQVAERLSEREVVVSKLHADWSSFGSWHMEVQRGPEADRYHKDIAGPDPMQAMGPEVFRFIWDGKDRYLMVHASPTRALSAPNEWRKEEAKFCESFEEALQHVERFIETKFPLPPKA